MNKLGHSTDHDIGLLADLDLHSNTDTTSLNKQAQGRSTLIMTVEVRDDLPCQIKLELIYLVR